MIQLQIVGGQSAGSCFVPRRLPVQIGRGARDDLKLGDDGVWESHASIELTADGFFRLIALSEGLVCVEGLSVTEARVKNGDIIDIGAAKMVFHLARAQQRGLAIREGFLWLILLTLPIGELLLMFWLG